MYELLSSDTDRCLLLHLTFMYMFCFPTLGDDSLRFLYDFVIFIKASILMGPADEQFLSQETIDFCRKRLESTICGSQRREMS